jgi:hypothetical protein
MTIYPDWIGAQATGGDAAAMPAPLAGMSRALLPGRIKWVDSLTRRVAGLTLVTAGSSVKLPGGINIEAVAAPRGVAPVRTATAAVRTVAPLSYINKEQP